MTDFSFLINWYNFKNNIDSEVISLPVLEYPQVGELRAFIACTKNPWGEKIIKKINKMITPKNMLKARSHVREWQPADGSQREFDELNKRVYGF